MQVFPRRKTSLFPLGPFPPNSQREPFHPKAAGNRKAEHLFTLFKASVTVTNSRCPKIPKTTAHRPFSSPSLSNSLTLGVPLSDHPPRPVSPERPLVVASRHPPPAAPSQVASPSVAPSPGRGNDDPIGCLFPLPRHGKLDPEPHPPATGGRPLHLAPHPLAGLAVPLARHWLGQPP